jgi:hypothetical protein
MLAWLEQGLGGHSDLLRAYCLKKHTHYNDGQETDQTNADRARE